MPVSVLGAGQTPMRRVQDSLDDGNLRLKGDILKISRTGYVSDFGAERIEVKGTMNINCEI